MSCFYYQVRDDVCCLTSARAIFFFLEGFLIVVVMAGRRSQQFHSGMECMEPWGVSVLCACNTMERLHLSLSVTFDFCSIHRNCVQYLKTFAASKNN